MKAETPFLFQMPQSALSKENVAQGDTKPPSEDVITANQLSTVEGHMTVGESSGCEETSDDSYRDQPRACAGDQVNECSTENETVHEEGRSFCLSFLYFQSIYVIL